LSCQASWELTDVPCFEFVWGALPGLRSASAVDEIWRGDFDISQVDSAIQHSGLTVTIYSPHWNYSKI